MKNLSTLSIVLSWINLVIGSILVLGGLVTALVAPGLMAILTNVVLTGSVVLHSYAAIQLHRSIRYPQVPLSAQTPVGIRFVGFVALFFGTFTLFSSVISVQHASEIAKQVKLPIDPKNFPFNVADIVRGTAIFQILISIGIIINVLINIRLLRWYLLGPRN